MKNIKNNLFNRSEITKYSKNKSFDLSVSKYDFIKNYVEMVENSEFESEESSYLDFYDFLKDVLGYTREDIDFQKKYGKGRVEFSLKSNEKNFMVCELKDQNTDLDKQQNRVNDKRTPVQQAFDYARDSDIQNPVNWILVSNFKEFRLYNYNERPGKCICFSYKDLLDKKNFSLFMVAFSKKSHVENNYPNTILEKSLVIEKNIEKNFYRLFHETRLMLIAELEYMNPKLTREDSIHYAQLILNRYMFISFAEDTGLLDRTQISTETIKTPIDSGDLGEDRLWNRLNELFTDINIGNERKKIPGYNGGLFEENLKKKISIRDIVEDQSIFQDTYQDWDYEKEIEEVLGDVDDDLNPIYKNMLVISSYDFSSQLDVNILGHIFENSIGDIEELKEDTKGRRKKEGIYYTPDYITDYICRNTIIPFLSRSGNSNNVHDLIEEYSWSRDIEDLDEKLKNIKIVDPACGSGAFLNKATDVLLEIHEAIFNFKKEYTTKDDILLGGRGKRRGKASISHLDLGAYVFDQIEKRREILLNNIYGVDLNEESVEITKLSLFLKVCRKDLKLPNLDKNIKNGNSLIDDEKYSDKPFKWEENFPEICNDGFDLVIGNPPYVRQEEIKDLKPYLEHYQVFSKLADLYVYFFEKGLKLLKNGGYFSVISSNKFTRTKYGKNLRKLILEYKLKKYIDYTGVKVFEDPVVDPCVIVIKKEPPESDSQILLNEQYEINQNRLNDSFSWPFGSPEQMDLNDKINENGIKIKDLPDIKISNGIKTGYNPAFIIDENSRDELINSDPKNIEVLNPIIKGKDIKDWKINFKNNYLVSTYIGFPIDNYPSIENYLNGFRTKLEKRAQVIRGDHKWYELDNNPTKDTMENFEGKKLVYPEISSKLFAVLDVQKFYINNKCFMITSQNHDLKFLSTLLSSKLLNFVFRFVGSPLGKDGFEQRKIFINQLPICSATLEQQQPLIEKADRMLKLNHQLMKEVNGFHDWLQHTFNIASLSKKLEKYYKLSLEEFLIEVEKKRVNVRSRRNYTILKKAFKGSVEIIQPLFREIQNMNDEIDRIVYELYGLSEDEIEIIEDSFND